MAGMACDFFWEYYFLSKGHVLRVERRNFQEISLKDLKYSTMFALGIN